MNKGHNLRQPYSGGKINEDSTNDRDLAIAYCHLGVLEALIVKYPVGGYTQIELAFYTQSFARFSIESNSADC
jgi:hypothetical protein